jgi:hypothetical protein
MKRQSRRSIVALVIACLIPAMMAWAEYADVILNNNSDTGIRMEQLMDGRYCGACHDGGIAWPLDNCDLCHSGKPGLETGVKGSHQTTGPGIY